MIMKSGSLTSLVCILILVASAQLCPAQQVKQEKKLVLATSTTAVQRSSLRIGSLVAQWMRAKQWTQEYIDKMPEGGLGFKPVPEVRSFAEQMLHLAYWNFAFAARAVGQTIPYKEEELLKDEFKTKARLNKVVTESYDFVINGIKGLNDAQLDEQITMSNGAKLLRLERISDAYEHQTHHRGQTAVYLRLKGLVPPIEPF